MSAEPEPRQGFTLLELLIVLLISGILLGMGLGLFSTERNSLREAARLLVTAAVTARSRAMLLKAPVVLRLSSGQVEVSGSDGKRWERALPRGVEAVSLNDAPLSDGARAVAFHPLGIVPEHVMVLHSGTAWISVYVPATGGPRVLEGRRTLEQIRKESL